MPHGGYHGTVKMGGNVVQQGYQDSSGDYQVRGGIDNSSRLDFNPPQSNQNNQTAAEAKEEIEKKFPILSGKNIFTESGYKNPNLIDYGVKHTMVPKDLYSATSIGADDVKARAQQFNLANQRLNNLLRAEQEINLANQLRSTFAKAGTGKADALRPLFTGDLGDKTFLGMNLGSTERPAATVINPFTGERITTGKVREGMTSPEYAQYMSELYGLNPALMEETFPFGSGQIAKPILARIGEGIMGIPGASEIGQMGGDILNAMISPISGIFSGKKTATPKIQYDNMGNPVGIISQLPESDGEDFDITAPKLDLGQYSAIPEDYKGFFESEFAKPVAGGAAITYVTLPDGRRIRFGDTGSAAQFRKYLESIGVTPQEEPTEKVEVETPKEEKAPFDLAQFYAGLPTFNQSPYARQGLGSYNEMLRKYFG
jgi:hypothetical protein